MKRYRQCVTLVSACVTLSNAARPLFIGVVSACQPFLQKILYPSMSYMTRILILCLSVTGGQTLCEVRTADSVSRPHPEGAAHSQQRHRSFYQPGNGTIHRTLFYLILSTKTQFAFSHNAIV